MIALFCRQYDIIKDNEPNNSKEKAKSASENSTPEHQGGGLLRSKVSARFGLNQPQKALFKILPSRRAAGTPSTPTALLIRTAALRSHLQDPAWPPEIRFQATFLDDLSISRGKKMSSSGPPTAARGKEDTASVINWRVNQQEQRWQHTPCRSVNRSSL